MFYDYYSVLAGGPKHQVFYDYAARMKIWRVPEPNLETPEKYSDRGREYWLVWNREVPIEEFVQKEAPKYIQVYLLGQGILVTSDGGSENWLLVMGTGNTGRCRTGKCPWRSLYRRRFLNTSSGAGYTGF